MTLSKSDILHRRLYSQGLSKLRFKTPKDVVAHFGAIQAQDYAGAKWALGLRLKDSTDADIEQTFTDGSILRTHLLRPTWHFVTPTDIRWLLGLTAPRVHSANASMVRNLEIDSRITKRSHAILEKALRDGNHLTRNQLALALIQGGITADNNLRFTYLVMSAELDGLICSGPRRGKQFTYALLEERVPPAKKLARDEALAELTKRYFMSHGPATLKDFAWWSGLTMADVKNGVDLVRSQFVSEVVDKQTYWLHESQPPPGERSTMAHLLPNYDEYIVGYTDRSFIHDASHNGKLDARGNVLFQNTIVVNGQVTGTWKRTLKKKLVEIELNPFGKLTRVGNQTIVNAAGRHGDFLGLPTEVSWKS